MQWLTGIKGLFQSWATVRATAPTLTKGAPIPGPLVKHTTSICFGSKPAAFRASSNNDIIFFWWCWAVSRGRKPIEHKVLL